MQTTMATNTPNEQDRSRGEKETGHHTLSHNVTSSPTHSTTSPSLVRPHSEVSPAKHLARKCSDQSRTSEG